MENDTDEIEIFMGQKYLIRLDDACPTMDSIRWAQMETLLDSYDIKPMVGVVPDNTDDNLNKQEAVPDFWEKVHVWKDKGWAIAMHGYNHCYISNEGMSGLNPMWERSEFAGVSFAKQKEKIHKGVEIFREYGINPHFFFAPSHTFDENTLIALREESDIRIISDTIGRYPYIYDDFYFIPQITGHCVKMPFNGIYTFCFHPNTMSDFDFQRLEAFLKKHHTKFISFDNLHLDEYGRKKTIDRLMSWLFFKYRRLKGVY